MVHMHNFMLSRRSVWQIFKLLFILPVKGAGNTELIQQHFSKMFPTIWELIVVKSENSREHPLIIISTRIQTVLYTHIGA